MSESWRTVPHFSGREIRVDGLFEAAGAGKAAGVGLTATDFMILALADALNLSARPPTWGWPWRRSGAS